MQLLSRTLLRHYTSKIDKSGANFEFQPFIKPSTLQTSRPVNGYDAQKIAMEKKRKFASNPKVPRKVQRLSAFLPEGSGHEILDIEISDLLARASLENTNGHVTEGDVPESSDSTDGKPSTKFQKPAELEKEVELEVVALSSTGDGLAYNEAKDHIFIIPFTVPGDRVLAKPWTWKGRHTIADFIKVIRPSPDREGVTPKCPYFSTCSGCQFQMLPYEQHLKLKQDILQKAFDHFSGLGPGQLPELTPTMGSPLQYGYRTKLTPHFQGPTRSQMKSGGLTEVPAVGFNMKSRNKVLDIEACPIGTDILQDGLRRERAKVVKQLSSYKRGATILLRETTDRTYATDHKLDTTASDQTNQEIQSTNTYDDPSTGEPVRTISYSTHTDTKKYTSVENSQVTEYITTTIDPTTNPPTTKTYMFTNWAGSFFQNNNSILGPFTSYIYSKCKPQSSGSDNLKYLLDAYSGSGLFTLTMSSLFKSSLGIDVDRRAIDTARLNAEQNNVQNAGFVDADASALFADVPYPPDQTVLIIDPPRKGCDREFLKQLRVFGPKRVVYVSCNVHSQARDVGIMVNGFRKDKRGWYGGKGELTEDEAWEEEGLWKYDVESLRGFDFFPQTGHVEGVCVLNRREKEQK